MKRVCFFLFTSIALFGNIIEIKHISELKTYVTSDTFVIFDLDNTLFETAQDLGSPQWFYHRQSQFCQDGYSASMALKAALAEWRAIQNITEVVPVEEETSNFVNHIQQQGNAVMGLSTRGLDTVTCTLDQVRSIKVDLGRTSPIHSEMFFDNGEICLYRQGVLFTNGTDHGSALQKLLQQANYTPKRIVYVNDKSSQLRAVGKMCEEKNIPYTCLRYTYLDTKVKKYSPEISEIQLRHFGKILTNLDVEKILKEDSAK